MSTLPAVVKDTQTEVVSYLTPEQQIKEAAHQAKLLKNIVDERKLARKFGGEKEHLYFEAWQFLASWNRLNVMIEWTHPITNLVGDKIIGYEAKAIVKNEHGDVVSSAESQCMADEGNWRNKPTYSLRSMAQTRAGSKALRFKLSYVVVLAGYSATPVEEMDGIEVKEEKGTVVQTHEAPKSKPAPSKDESQVHPDEASPPQKKKLFAMAMEYFGGDRDKALDFIRWALAESGQEYWTKKNISGFFDQFNESTAGYEASH